MRTFKLILLALYCISFTHLAIAQDGQLVSMTTTGQGSTAEDATQVALRKAVEQAYGVYISSSTKIFNDELVSDVITSVASGNIVSYEVISESSDSEKQNFFVSSRVLLVGKNKLISF